MTVSCFLVWSTIQEKKLNALNAITSIEAELVEKFDFNDINTFAFQKARRRKV